MIDNCNPYTLPTIHIEICYSLSGGNRFTKAEENAAEYTAYLLKKYGWGIDKVTKHQDYDGKYCPHRTLDLGWTRFLNMVKKYFNEEDDEMLSYDEFKKYMEKYEAEQAAKDTSKWAEEAVDYCNENGLMVGDKSGFRSHSNITRQEVAQVAMRLHKSIPTS